MRFPRGDGQRWRGRFLYVAQRKDDGTLKVGIASSVRQRLTAFGAVDLVACWWVRSVEVVNKWGWRNTVWTPRMAEIDCHARLHPSLIKGEWFRPDDEALLLIAGLRKSRRYPRPIGSARDAPSSPHARRAWLAEFYSARARGLSLKASAVAAEKQAQLARTLGDLRRQIRGLELAGQRLSRALAAAMVAA